MTLARHYDAATAPRGVLRHVLPLLGYPSLIWRNRYMVQNFLRRDLTSRAHGSFLGVWWLLVQPLFQFALYYLIFGVMLGNYHTGEGADVKFAIYLFSGVIVYYSLVEAVTQSCSIVVDNGNLVKKVAFPSEVLPFHVALVSIVIYLVGVTVCYIAGLVLGALHPGWLLLALPLVLAVQFTFILGLGLLIANANVFIRDVSQLLRIVTMAWMFLTPVFWKPQQMVDALKEPMASVLFHANPAFPLIQAHRIALGVPDVDPAEFWGHLGSATIWAVACLVLGYTSFVSSKHKYADLI